MNYTSQRSLELGEGRWLGESGKAARSAPRKQRKTNCIISFEVDGEGKEKGNK